MRPAFLLATFALFVSAPEAHAAFSASASAWGYGGSDAHTQIPTASAHWHGTGPDFPGYTDATGHTKFAYVGAVSTVFGCGSNAGFQEVCNQGGTGGDWSDMVTFLASAPNGTPVSLRVTLALAGTIDGTGGYFYQAQGGLCAQSSGINGTTGGGVVTRQGFSIDDTRVWDMTVYVGDRCAIWGHLDTQVLNRICAGGTGTCTPSISEWTMTLSAATTLRVEQLSSVPGFQILGDSGHNYLDQPTGVAMNGASLGDLWVTSANPSPGPVAMALRLEKASRADVAVFDLSGRRLATLASGVQPAGTHSLTWDGRDLAGRAVCGMCFVRARCDGFTAQRQLVMLR